VNERSGVEPGKVIIAGFVFSECYRLRRADDETGSTTLAGVRIDPVRSASNKRIESTVFFANTARDTVVGNLRFLTPVVFKGRDLFGLHQQVKIGGIDIAVCHHVVIEEKR
jgi:hypothetical protein